jgi:chromosome partitioning protein
MNTVERQLDPGLGHLLRLRAALVEARPLLDIVLLDCPPGLRDLSKVGLLCGDELLVPVEASFMALQGLAELAWLADQAKDLNPHLRWCGIFLTRYTDRTIMSTQALSQLEVAFPDRLLPVRVPEGTRFKEAPGHREPITVYDPEGAGAAAYRDLAKVVLAQQEVTRV